MENFRPQVSPPRGYFRAFSLVALLVHFLGAQNGVHADSMDVKISKQAPKILNYLKNQRCSSVGILNFEVQSPGKEKTFLAGALNVNMAERLENALVLNLRAEDKLKILHNAGDVIAAKKKKINYEDKKNLKEIFTYEYPLAWGTAKTSPDALLTGVVQIQPNKREAMVVIRVLDRQLSWDSPDDLKFTVPVDGGLLSDLGKYRRGTRVAPLVAETDSDDNTTEEKNPHESSLLELKLVYGNDAPLIPTYDSSKQQEVVPDPKRSGEDVVLLVRNKFSEKIGLILLVNGLNTLGHEVRPREEQYQKWILEPDKPYAIRGYYTDKKLGKGESTLNKFQTFNDQEFEALSTSLPDRGVIAVKIFVTGKKPELKTDPPKKEKDKVLEESGELKVSLRGLSQKPNLKDRRNLSLEELKRELATSSGLLRFRGGFAESNKKDDEIVPYDDLPHPVKVEERYIRFYRGK